MTNRPYRLLLLSLLLLLFAAPTFSQKNKKKSPSASDAFELPSTVKYRNIGPFRGGRSAAVTGVPGKPNLYYFGAAGGGVFRTKDGGGTWENISDGYFGGSVGAVAVSEWDNNVIYVGGGEVTVRGNVSYGYGVWKSEDAGKTWQEAGLKNSRHIPRIRIHPRNPDLVYAAVLGDLFKPSQERGVYRSQDGGKNWERILFANENAGAADLTFDPQNPRILYATTWNVRRTPYSLSSGGEGSAMWKSTDGGDTWTEISRNKGLPQTDTLGIIGVTVSPVNGERVWAIVEAKSGGVFRSDDGGETWKKINDERKLRQRAWYYSRIYADPKDQNVLYALNVSWFKSKDGGKSWERLPSEHGDHHDLWIDPENPQRMVIGDDGGAQVSNDGGYHWTTYYNQPTAQFYRVTTDNSYPYRIYVAQQDNSTVRIDSRSDGSAITENNWEPTAGCECGHIAPDPDDNDIVYGGCYDGFLERKNHKRDLTRIISVWPDNPMGHGAEELKYRFQWNFPLFFSPHDSDKLYTASNYLHVSTDEGQSWQTISPDLTRNDKNKQKSSGGPITQDNTSVEYYCTIFAAVESPLEQGTIWTGSDDGLVHVTRDGGANWTNVTPTGLPEWAQINSMEADPFNAGGVYLAATRYKSGDYAPYLYHTADYGQTWRKIVNGIDRQHFTRVIRADQKQQGMLYVGTETGMYYSTDNGASWRPLQLNLPVVPITDLAVKGDDLVVATQGRSVWILDDLHILRQQKKDRNRRQMHLYQPTDTYRTVGRQNEKVTGAGMNKVNGVVTHFYLPETPDSTEIRLTYHTPAGDLIREFSNKAKKKNDPEKRGYLETKAGDNIFHWNLRYPDADRFEGMILWWADMSGPRVVPGDYRVRLHLGDEMQEQKFTVLADPRAEASQADMQKQFDFLQEVRAKINEAHTALGNIKKVRKQLDDFTGRLDKENEAFKPLFAQADSIKAHLKPVEEALYQTKNRARQDPLNFPIRLTNKLAHLTSLLTNSDYAPTEQMYGVKEEMTQLIDRQLAEYRRITEEEIPVFNRMVREAEIGVIRTDGE